MDDRLIGDMEYWGDGWVLMVNGLPDRIKHLAAHTGTQHVEAERLRQWLGVGGTSSRTRGFPNRRPVSTPGTVILPEGMGAHLVGHHGGITPQELLIPLLVA